MLHRLITPGLPIATTVAFAAAVMGALPGCGSEHSDRNPAAKGARAVQPASSSHGTGSRAARGPVLLVFKRESGVDPMASYFTLYTSGQGVATVVYGGVDGAKVHTFQLGAARLQRVERLLRRTRLRDTRIVNPNLFTYWVITRRSSHRLSQGVVPRSSRPLLGELNAIADANNLF